MAEKRSLFQNIFGKAKNNNNNQYQTFKLLNSYQTQFIPFSGNAWDINAVRSAVDTFARNAAKVSPRHIRRTDGIREINDNMNKVLRFQPNPYMSAYAFYYKVATQYLMYNNAFIYPVWNNGKLEALYPINASVIELLEYQGEMFFKFKFINGKSYVCDYKSIIHLRRHFNDNDIFGSDNKPILPVLETATTLNQSMSKFAELVSVIRGILKVQTTSKTEDLNKRRDDFIRDNLKMDSNGAGVIVTDNRYDYTNLDSKQTPIPTSQLEYIRKEIFDYFGTNDNIVQNKASADEWDSYYEGQLEPLFIQMAQEFTNCLFTESEKNFGNEIVFESNRLQYATLPNKVAAAKFLCEIGAASLNQILEIFNMSPLDGDEGKRRVQTLNMVNAQLADEYQVGKVEKGENKNGGNENAD